MSTTARQLFKGAMRLINVIGTNEEPTADDMDITREAFNAMVGSMGTDLLNIYTFTPHKFVLTPGQWQYTLGPAVDSAGANTNADWVIERPMRIEQMKLILNPEIDGSNVTITTSSLFLPINMLQDEDFASIRVRYLSNKWPTVCYDDGGFPTRQLNFWPIPTEVNAVEIWMWEPLAIFDNLDEVLNFPPGYERYLRTKLAIEIAPEFGKSVSPSVMESYLESRNNIKGLNQQIPKKILSRAAYSIGQRQQQFTYIDMIRGDALPLDGNP